VRYGSQDIATVIANFEVEEMSDCDGGRDSAGLSWRERKLENHARLMRMSVVKVFS